ncbi:VOC family protein [Microvirga sp. TS319]|uniref:VOC family protein n=1 Tax=Microvirga sp. TS319 TaxID=3241165 RepID=UPI00351A9D45
MIRVADENRSKAFYEKAFGFKEAARFPFETFTLVYLLDEESGTELELTINHDREEPYAHGDGYGHIAMVVDDLEAEHKRHTELGYDPTAVKEFFRDGALMAKFFFVQGPDGYKIEVLQRHGRYQ